MKYVQRFKGRLNYRRPVPRDLQQFLGLKVWKRALGTAVLTRSAEHEVLRLADEHDKIIADARAVLNVDAPAEERVMALRSIRKHFDIDGPSNPRASGSAVVTTPEVRSVLGAAQKGHNLRLRRAEDRIRELGAEDKVFVEGIGGARALLHAYHALCRNEAAEDRFAAEARVKRISEYATILIRLGIDVGRDDPNNPRLSKAIDQWFASRQQQASARRRHRVAVNRFIQLHGDREVASIERGHIQAYVKAMENCADHRRLPSKMRGSLIDPGIDVPRVSAPTVERHLISIKALLTFAVEQGWCAANPANGIRAPKDSRPKASQWRPWAMEERRAVLTKAIEEDDEDGDMPWLIRLAVYTGARLQELVQLSRQNVREIDGVACIEIDDLEGRHLKTEASVRTVPLHPAIAQSFSAWVKKGKGPRVFMMFQVDDDGRYSNDASARFSALRNRTGLDKRLKFHTLRDTFIDAMRNARLDADVRRAIVGHAARTAHDDYGDGPSLETIAAELTRLPAQI